MKAFSRRSGLCSPLIGVLTSESRLSRLTHTHALFRSAKQLARRSGETFCSCIDVRHRRAVQARSSFGVQLLLILLVFGRRCRCRSQSVHSLLADVVSCSLKSVWQSSIIQLPFLSFAFAGALASSLFSLHSDRVASELAHTCALSTCLASWFASSPAISSPYHSRRQAGELQRHSSATASSDTGA